MHQKLYGFKRRKKSKDFPVYKQFLGVFYFITLKMTDHVMWRKKAKYKHKPLVFG